MRASKVLAKFEKTAATWRTRLGAIPEDDFTKQPADGGWSAAQVCHHIAMASDGLLGGARTCIENKGETRGFSFLPALITTIGTFPPAKVKVPGGLPPEWAQLAHPEQKPKAECLHMFDSMVDDMRSLRDAVEAAPRKMRLRHPAAGWLHARQWYQINEMHMRHHLRQLARLEKQLRA